MKRKRVIKVKKLPLTAADKESGVFVRFGTIPSGVQVIDILINNEYAEITVRDL